MRKFNTGNITSRGNNFTKRDLEGRNDIHKTSLLEKKEQGKKEMRKIRRTIGKFGEI